MLKKMLSFALAAILCLGVLASCGGDNEPASEAASNSSAALSEPSDGSLDNSIEPDNSQEDNEMPEYWGYNNYEDFTNPNAPEEITSFPTTVKKESATRYSMTSETEVGKLTVTLEERPWGMFNLWSWKLVDKNGKTHVFVAGSTDWEYVFRTVTPNGSTAFTGGNHGDEAFISLDLYNAENGEKLDLQVGESVTVNSLHVIEKSKLLWIPDNNGDSIGDYDNKSKTYTEDDVFANATRKYTFTGPQIKLNVDFEYVKDVKHYHSYQAMFPIDKKYGLWCDMIDREGKLITTIETLKVGAADYSGKEYNGNAATRVLLYGHVDPRYQFDLRINTPTDSLGNFANTYKTCIWDMNTTTNKIYFSKYGVKSPDMVKAGTEVHTEMIWLFKFVEDAVSPQPSEPEAPFEEFVPSGTLASSGKSYAISGNGVGYAPYTASLTDGKTVNGLTYDGNWFGFLLGNENNTVDGVGSVIIDLGEEKELSGVRAHICNGETAGISAPAKITLSMSSDGSAFSDPVEIPVNRDTAGVYWTGKAVSGKGRYVKLDFTLAASFVFLDEIEVYTK